jgi:dihydroflavonol-4-reductase
MLICVTGGTGFVGSHSVAAILHSGSQVRLLVRDPATVGPVLEPLGIDMGSVEVTVADITDELSMAAALDGVDAILHTASANSVDRRAESRMRQVTAHSTQLLFDAAEKADVKLLVHVAGITGGAAEMVAWRFQSAGYPVVITYPPALLGPNDPQLGEQNSRLRSALRGLMPLWPSGGLAVGDVRDTAAMHAALFSPTPKPKTAPNSPISSSALASLTVREHYIGPYHYVTARRFVGALRDATGRPLPTVFRQAPTGPAPALLDGCGQRYIKPRPLAETMADTVRWLYQDGQLSAKQAGLIGRLTARPRRGRVAGAVAVPAKVVAD